LARSDLPERPDPEAALTRILELYERFVKKYPDHAKGLLERCEELTRTYRSLEGERVLGVIDAVRFTGLTPARIQQLGKAGRAGELRDGRWRFSEAELHWYLHHKNKPGRPPKKSPSRPEGAGFS